jgi:AraC-like DNA-binding protein
MKPIHYKIPRLEQETIRVECWDLPYFYEPLHFHEECQVTYILDSEGLLLLGDKLDRFKTGDLYIIGPNLPHVFRNDATYFNDRSKIRARAISVFFLKESLHGLLNSIPEARQIKRLFQNADFGVRFNGESSAKILPHLKKLLRMEGIHKVFEFLETCSQMSVSKNVEILSTKAPMILNSEDSDRLEKVFDYINRNHHKNITLEEVADLICMTPTSFCRYFKRWTQKTFSQYLIEVRINSACTYLVKKGYNVSEACYSSGYNNISNFHRHFMNITGMTPNVYKHKAVNA